MVNNRIKFAFNRKKATMNQRIHNFNPGPSALPLPVLEQIQAELLDYNQSGMSVMEMSHRSQTFDQIIKKAENRVRRLMNLSDDYSVLFMQGGASLQFALIPMNLAGKERPVYINTGTWSTKAIAEARIQGCDPIVAASSEDLQFRYIPDLEELPTQAPYVHITSNNTIKGTQWAGFPKTDSPLVVDMSSDILSRPMDMNNCGMIYAGAQKNLGPSGVTLVIIRQDLLDRVPQGLPTMLRYETHAKARSLYNTPPSFSIYVVGLVLKWLEEEIGGLEKMAARNQRKADKLYAFIDSQTDFYRGTARSDSRSLMNVTFRLPSEELEKAFIEQALKNGIGGVKGHKSVGGCRASIYNAVSEESVDTLIAFMTDFAQKNG
jgi:phosphoserine aminotransferase